MIGDDGRPAATGRSWRAATSKNAPRLISAEFLIPADLLDRITEDAIARETSTSEWLVKAARLRLAGAREPRGLGEM